MGGGLNIWRRMVADLFVLCWELAYSRAPDFIVGTKTDPYLKRWWVIPRNPFFNVYLHQFLRSDDDRAHHDHPWWSLSLLLAGRYFEHTIDAGGVARRVEYRSGTLRLRSGRFAHRLEIARNEQCWSLFITGPVVREWGFHCAKGWVPWHLFTRTFDGTSGIGAGCDAPSRRPRSLWRVWRGENA